MATEKQAAEHPDNRDKLRETSEESAAQVVEFLKRQILDLQAQIKDKDDEIRKVKVNAAVDAALLAAGAKNVTAAKALIPGLDEMEFSEDGSVKGLAEKISAIKVSDGYLFEQRGGKFTMRGAKPGESCYDGVGGVDVSKMTYSQLADYIKKNPTAKVFD